MKKNVKLSVRSGLLVLGGLVMAAPVGAEVLASAPTQLGRVAAAPAGEASTAPAGKAPAAKATAIDAKAVAKYRHNQMEAMAKHMKALVQLTKGEVPFADQALVHAEGLHALGKTIPSLFPKGTEPSNVKSDSKAEVWTQWDKFLELSKKSDEATAALVAASKSGDMARIGLEFKNVGKSCSNCHDLFRVEEE